MVAFQNNFCSEFDFLLVALQVKWLVKGKYLKPATTKFLPARSTFNHKFNFNYLQYHFAAWWIFWNLFLKPKFFGLAQRAYYTLEPSKKLNLLNKNFYKLKIQLKKDTWFFYGIVISKKINFLSSSITIWNVFYNQVMEKTFQIFNIWNFLLSGLKTQVLQHSLTWFIKHKWFKRKFYFIWNYSRAVTRIVHL
jgi:hypothetical protein